MWTLEIFGLKTLYDPVACHYVNTPSAYDMAVWRPTSCRYFSSLWMIMHRTGFSASAELLVFVLFYCLIVYFSCPAAVRNIFHTPVTQCSLFVLKVPLNTNQPISLAGINYKMG